MECFVWRILEHQPPKNKAEMLTTRVFYWRERAAFQRSAFERSTAGNYVVATIFIRLFFSSFFSVFPGVFFPFFSPSRPFLIEGVFGSKTYLAKVA